LCGEQRKLYKIYIFPRFVGRWIEETSATGYPVKGSVPFKGGLDVSWERVLCDECKQRFSHLESHFAQRIFYPLHADDDRHSRFEYDDWLMKFIVSISWRVAVNEYEEFIEDQEYWKDDLDKALEAWRRFLLNDGSSPSPYTHHIFIFPEFQTTSLEEEAREVLSSYIHLGCDSSITFSRTDLCVYTHLPNIIMTSFIVPPSRDDWIGTQVSSGKNTTGSPQSINEAGFAYLLICQMDPFYSHRFSSTREQIERTVNSILNNPDK
jgi:hypothetical protein